MGRRLRGIRRELRSPVTLLLVVACVVAGVWAALVLTPDQDVEAFGQQISVGVQPPSATASGPPRIVQIGNTSLDVPDVTIYGPIRPQLSIGPVQRNETAGSALESLADGDSPTEALSAIVTGFEAWFGKATLILVAVVLGVCGLVGSLRVLATLRLTARRSGAGARPAVIARRLSRTLTLSTITALAVSLVVWGACGALAVAGAQDLRSAESLTDLTGAHHVTPSPVGPTVSGVRGVVIGDSRVARLGGTPAPGASPEDVACARSSDSLARQLGAAIRDDVLNLACSGARIATGLRGPQQTGGVTVPPQIGRLKQVEDPAFVVVAVGPNDLNWTDLIGYCYAVADCADNFTAGEFRYRLAAFDRDYADLLADLATLPSKPRVVVMTSYDVLRPDARCSTARGPLQYPGLTPEEIQLLSDRNAELNGVLTAGAARYGFDVVAPPLTPLCEPSPDGLGPDLQSLDDPHPFHPTGVGELRLAIPVVDRIGLPPAAAPPPG
ncbi:GDSL-like lipase/acylhydrolase family protein [Actinomycetospora succinea]|uniref:GDSL-like lipase/acylhydrolase family protein n=1 Tax=Actinomycetospora succinea TaxID=663603 RepID=A0A4R6VH99_9PSEU|nr:GDSL-type esterase/lipase family protein [Actinomycetospora succinea]TDQ60840.1 GDSL-like lipase/acylhydrolase family protein [Actinomycetospora succinea]